MCIRLVQEERKKAGLDVADKIALHLDTDADVLKQAITAHEAMDATASEVQAARARLPKVRIEDAVARPAIATIQSIGLDSLRAEITWFEAARGHAAAAGREQVLPADLRAVAPMSLRLRRSQFMAGYFEAQSQEETEMAHLLEGLDSLSLKSRPRRKKK